jgi:hypothetical protein
LGVAGLLQGLRTVRIGVRVEDDVQQGPVEYLGNRFRTPGHGLGEHRLGVEQLAGHAHVLTALAGEQPSGLGCVGPLAADQARRRAVVRQRVEQLARRIEGIHHEGGPMFEMGASRTRGQAHVGQRDFGMVAEPVAVVRGGLRQGGGGARRQRQHHELAVVGDIGGFSGDRCRDRRLLKDDVSVGSGESERADAGDAGPVGALPTDRLVHHADRDAVPRDVR